METFSEMKVSKITRKKILLVDNNKVILTLLTHMLQKKGHEVKTAENGLSALEILVSYRPDVMFIDLIMPNISGDILCRVIRKRKEFDRIFLVILSAIAAEEQVDFSDFGADACIAKGPAKEMEKHILTVLAHIEKGGKLPFVKEILGVQNVYEREITKELLEKKNHFEITLENMGGGFLELTWSGKVVLANSIASVFFNTPEEELLSSNFLDYFEKKQRDYIAGYLGKLQRTPIEIGEDHLIAVNGKSVLLKFVPVIYQDKKTIIVLINDITQRKQTEQKLNDSMSHLEKIVIDRTEAYDEINKKLQEKISERMRINDELEFVARQWSTTFDTIPDFISIHDKNMKFVRVNKALATFFGKDPEELLGKTCYEVMHNRKSPWPNCPHVKSIEKNEVITEVVDDKYIGFPMLVTCSPCFHDDGSLMGTVHVARDISQQKKTESEQEALIEKLQNAYHIINESPIVACLWENTTEWPLQFVSENVLRLTGYSKDEFLSGTISYSQLIHPEDLERVQNEVVLHSRQSDKPSFVHEPYRIITKNNETKWIFDHTEIRRDGKGNITHYQGLIEDITQKIQLEEKEQQLLIKKEQSKRFESLKTMAGAIAHRFNNSMMAVLGNLDLMTLTLPKDSDEYKMALDATQAARGASQVGSMMLSYVGQQPLTLQESSLSDIARESVNTFKSRFQPLISLQFTPPGQPLYCSMDKKQIKEVIECILTNAVESLNDDSTGTIEITFGTDYFATDSFPVSFQDETLQSGMYTFCQIKDTGHGISPEDLSRIFEPFYTTRFVGRGLGLALTVGIMRAHHGAITVESVPAMGTTVRVLLPSIQPSQQTIPFSEDVKKEAMQLSGDILLADDEEIVLDVGRKMFEILGFTVHTAVNGQEAAGKVRKQDIDFVAVVLDISMPEMDGIEAMNVIRRINPALPVLLSSGYSEDAFSFTEEQGGKPDGFLSKPFQLSDIRSSLEMILS